MRLNVAPGIILVLLMVSMSTVVFNVIPARATPSDPPIHIHLTWQNETDTTMTVTWQTNTSTAGDTVLYDIISRSGVPASYSYSASGFNYTYSGASGYIHDVELTDLTPDTVYYFICGGDTGGWSNERAFRTAPSVSSDVRFVMGGDSRTYVEERTKISKAMAKFNPAFAMHCGDMVDSGTVQSLWDIWFTDVDSHWIGENNLTIPIIPALGNHEAPEITGCKYFVQFALPGNEKWYSYNWGPDIHIICLDSETDASGAQRDWLENDLATHADYTWKFVLFHRPPFTASGSPWTPALTYWVPLFDKYHVDIVFTGHEHNYQRSYPLNWTASQTEPQDYSNGTMYIVSGGWGAPLDDLGSIWYMAYQNKTYHFCLVDVFKNGTLHLQAKDNQGNTFDEVTIYKPVAADVVVWLESNRNATLFTAPKVQLMGFLTVNCSKIPNTDFSLFCPGNWTSVDTEVFIHIAEPNDINYTLLIDWDLDCVWEPPYNDSANTTKETFDLQTLPGKKWNRTVTSPQNQTVNIEVYLCQQNHRYIGMGGHRKSTSALMGTMSETEEPTTPLVPSYNITFSYPDNETGVVKLVVPHVTYHVSPVYMFEFIGWVNTTVTMPIDAYGWLFTGNGSAPILGDVDCYTYHNYTGAYWDAPGDPYGFNDTLAAPKGRHPDTGPDCIPGTADDGFGNGTDDPPGSCVLYQLTNVKTMFNGPLSSPAYTWNPLFNYNWTGVWTTAVAYDVVIEPGSLINGTESEEVGEPWEFRAGRDHPEYATQYPPYPTPWKHPKCNAYVTFAGAWSLLNITTELGPLDILVDEREKMVREDCVIADINCDEKVNIKDIGVVAVAFGAEDLSFGKDGIPWTADDKTSPDHNWNDGADLSAPRGKINIKDIGRIAIDFGAKLTPQCIIRP